MKLKRDLNPWKKLTSNEIYDNPWINVIEDQVINPSGGKGIYGVINFKNKAIGIVPIDNEGNTWIVGQYRYTLNEYSWEIPMGGCPKGETLLAAAKRELKEETGLTAKKWTKLMRIHLSNSVTDEVGFVFVAQDLIQGETCFEDTEDLKIMKLPFKDVVDLVLEGEITDAVSVAGILKLFLMAEKFKNYS